MGVCGIGIWCDTMEFNALYEYFTPFYNIDEWSIWMKKKDYDMMVRIWDKQKQGERLFDKEIKWKRKYNKSREEFVTEEDGVKITRYKPSWIKGVL